MAAIVPGFGGAPGKAGAPSSRGEMVEAGGQPGQRLPAGVGGYNDVLDAWFAGYHPSVAAVVWLGHDQPRSLGDHESGGRLALPIWTDYMASALKGVPVEPTSPPDGVVSIGSDWYYQEYTPGQGVARLGTGEGSVADALPTGPAVEPQEKRSILDLFRN